MTYDFQTLEKRFDEIHEWLVKEYRGIHTGRATPSILDSVMVENYGAKTQISHIAAVTVEDARTLRIAPWDKNIIKSIEKAIANSNLGLSVSVDSGGLRAHFPILSEERREAVLRLVKNKLEEARISVRGERDLVWNDIQTQTKEGEMTEDDKFLFKEKLQSLVDAINARLEDTAARKETEVKS
ncbi:MAG TPA: ribosome-recycling factor [Candidatus Paceibacterota bacterium]|nr:ribosome-recycling factor [Candidatus Paceibacterota bacterium]